jgi:hypothetical protein
MSYGDDCGEFSGIDEFTRKTELLGQKLPQYRSVHHRSHMT